MASERSIVFFCVVDGAGYLPKAITALRSVRRFHPEATYAVVGALEDDPAALRMIADHGLEFAHLDLSDVFSDCRSFRAHPLARRHPPTPWPSETFWWFGAPDLFAAQGHTHSCALDGDVFGVGPLDLTDVLDGQSVVAGVAKPNGRINSGVLFLDHARAAEFDLLGEARRVYETAKRCGHRECTGFCRAKGDQGLLWEVEQVAGLPARRIDNAYNHMLVWDERNYFDKNERAPLAVDDSRILHLLSKPWGRLPRRTRPNPVMVEAYARWWDYAQEVWPDDDERERHFGRPHRIRRTARAGR